MKPNLEPLEKSLWSPNALTQIILLELLLTARFKSRGQQVVVNKHYSLRSSRLQVIIPKIPI